LTRTAKRFAFSRASRLEGRHAFASVFAFKCSVAGEFFQVYAKPAGAASRLGITVNKRYVPLAVARNFCKRLARETFRTHQVELGGVDFVVRARGPVPAIAAPQARSEVLALMRRVRRQCCNEDGASPKR